VRRGPRHLDHAAAVTAPPLSSRIRLRQLELIVAIGRGRSLRQAANDLHMTQPAATRMLQELEAHLGNSLFQRTRRGMVVTPAGEELLRFARSMLEDLRATALRINRLNEGLSGQVGIGSLVSGSPHLLMKVVGRLRSEKPAIHIVIREGHHTSNVIALRAGQLDMSIGRVHDIGNEPDLVHDVLYEEAYCLVCGPGHALARRSRLSLQDVVDQPLALPPRVAIVRVKLDARFMADCGRLPGNVLESVSVVGNLLLLAESPMLALMPRQVAEYFQSLHALKILPLPLTDISAPIVLVTRRGHELAAAAEYVKSELRRELGVIPLR
jgi:DNA-binding transcriptional LysR family regulator